MSTQEIDVFRPQALPRQPTTNPTTSVTYTTNAIVGSLPSTTISQLTPSAHVVTNQVRTSHPQTHQHIIIATCNDLTCTNSTVTTTRGSGIQNLAIPTQNVAPAVPQPLGQRNMIPERYNARHDYERPTNKASTNDTTHPGR
jgi:hypothetical protein